MIDAFWSEWKSYIYFIKVKKIHEDFLEEHEQNIKDFIQDLENRLYIEEK